MKKFLLLLAFLALSGTAVESQLTITPGLPVGAMMVSTRTANPNGVALLVGSGAPADIATIAVPYAKYRVIGSTGPNSGSIILTEPGQAGTPVAGTLQIFDGAGGTGNSVFPATAPGSGSNAVSGLIPTSTSTVYTSPTLYVRQTALSANAASVTVYLFIYQLF